MYHVVSECPENAAAEERGLFVAPGAFERQMAQLAEQGFRTLTLDEFAAQVHSVTVWSKRFLLTFDDSYAHIPAVVTPVLRRHGFTAVMFANWAHLGGRNTWDNHLPNLPRLAITSQDQLVDMAAGPWEIASHGYRHVDLRDLPSSKRREELVAARELLSALVKKPVRDIAYPYGRNDPEMRADVRAAGYRLGFCADLTRNRSPLRLSRRAVRNSDSMTFLRLRTAEWSDSVRAVARRVREVAAR
jgi:peptidoglycan/xylan/chitin deacetylase (PgdA/CDA1 family)